MGLGLYRDYIGIIRGLFRDYRGYIGVLGFYMVLQGLYKGYTGVIYRDGQESGSYSLWFATWGFPTILMHPYPGSKSIT